MQGQATAEAELSRATHAADEVWLRANPRPAAVLFVAMMAVAAVAAAVLIAVRPPAWGVAFVATACLAGGRGSIPLGRFPTEACVSR